ncbi:hypothetical protein [Dongia sp.]|uniref:hypothetical protein n=1 Tax=Dongia sp. TaxID=1977262 RepID=UPI0035B126C5
MGNAILFNTMRNTDREVTINLIDSGIEIVSGTGEPIAIWAYSVVDLLKETELRDEGPFVVAHDPQSILQVPDSELWNRIVERAPQARKTKREATATAWWRIWRGVPDQAAGALWIGIVLTIVWAGRQLYLWIFPS